MKSLSFRALLGLHLSTFAGRTAGAGSDGGKTKRNGCGRDGELGDDA
jgi:hypothetical protein